MRDEGADAEEMMEVDSTGQGKGTAEISALRRKMELGRQLVEEQKAEQVIQMADASNYRPGPKQFQNQQHLQV